MDDTSSFQIEAARPIDCVNEDFVDSGSDISSAVFLDDEENRSGLNVAVVSDATSSASDHVLGFEPNSEIDTTTLVDPISQPTEINIRTSRSIFEVAYVPVWGVMSICGRRSDMEDAVSIIPHFVEIPLQMLVDCPPNGLPPHMTHLTGHFFGVFDGHGGSQVSNYCRERIHYALSEEFETITTNLSNGNRSGSCEELWTRAFTKCFHKVDDEIGGKNGFQPVAMYNVGSTAIIALVCTSHIVVANCGDSRAVLCRGREAIPLSIDHKPNRADEYARVEAAGGQIIEWDGLRISGILAMSRSIGDQYLKPPVICDPEVMVVPRTREDECVILASDGLWDVMTNKEVCDVARRSIYLWYRNNPAGFGLSERKDGIDAASQAAVAALTTLALRKGSRDNISIIVLDLKRQRRKSRSKPRLA